MNVLFKILFFIVISGLALFACFLIYATIADYKPEPVTQISEIKNAGKFSVNKQLNFMIWNIGYCGLSKDMDFFYSGGKKVRPENSILNNNISNVKAFIKKQTQVDFFLLQEVDVNSKRSYGVNIYDEIQKLFPDYHSSFGKNYDVSFVPVPVFKPMGKVISGLQTLSAYHPESVTRHSFPGNFSWPKGLFMLDRCFLVSRFNLENEKTLVVINTHNSAFDDGSLRKNQMKYLEKFLKKEFAEGNYVIVGGDWNQCPPGFNPEFKDHIMDNKDRMDIPLDFMPDWKWLYNNKIPTNRRVDMPYNKKKTLTTVLDFFLVSPNIDAVKLETINLNFENSDHQPVLLTIKLKIT